MYDENAREALAKPAKDAGVRLLAELRKQIRTPSTRPMPRRNKASTAPPAAASSAPAVAAASSAPAAAAAAPAAATAAPGAASPSPAPTSSAPADAAASGSRAAPGKSSEAPASAKTGTEALNELAVYLLSKVKGNPAMAGKIRAYYTELKEEVDQPDMTVFPVIDLPSRDLKTVMQIVRRWALKGHSVVLLRADGGTPFAMETRLHESLRRYSSEVEL